MASFTPDQWIIIGLVFVLGILVGLFMLSGRGKKWKTLYKEEVARREAVEAEYKASEVEWRERDSLRAAAIKTGKVDVDHDGIDDRVEPGTQTPR